MELETKVAIIVICETCQVAEWRLTESASENSLTLVCKDSPHHWSSYGDCVDEDTSSGFCFVDGHGGPGAIFWHVCSLNCSVQPP